MNLPQEVINYYEYHFIRTTKDIDDNLCKLMLEKISTHNIVLNKPNHHFWYKFKCINCDKGLNEIVGSGGVGSDKSALKYNYDVILYNTLTCDEMIIKNILE